MSRWKQLDRCIRDRDLVDKEFTAELLGRACGIRTWEATTWIQSYKYAQRKGRTDHVIFRVPHTRGFNTVWRFGTKEADVTRIAILPTIDYAWLVGQLTLDLRSMAALDPQLQEKAQEAITTLELTVRLLAALSE